MPRPSAPTPAEMTRVVQHCEERFGLETSVLNGDALKAAHNGWAAVLWIETHAEPLDNEHVQALLSDTKIQAGHSAAKRLWRERVLHVAPLQTHYRLPGRVPQWVLKAGVAAGHLPAAVAPGVAAISPPESPYLLTLANKPSVLIDRATRGPGGWNERTLQYREVAEDGLVLNYYEENAAPEALRAQLMALDPRTSDVWRLLTAKALENETEDLFTPITIKPGELAHALGLKLHPNGSVRPKDVLRCTHSLFHLERLWLTLPGEGEGGPRKRVLAVMERGRARKIDGEDVPSSWTIVLGDWARYFPRSYAPIFRGLVELSANSATHLWAKQIGTELSYWIRETAGNPEPLRRITVQTLLTRASLLPDVLEMRVQRNQMRAVERFEATLELLGGLGLHEQWGYEAASAAALDRTQGSPAFFETWLSSLVELRVPEAFLASIAELALQEQAAERPARHLTDARPRKKDRA
ncbi:Type I-U CRISPR-associated protein Csx17 [Deinococcus saxicola]|uniref:hypothetical protein n=1 Tax=Deinococcus saxicola TaxID=249406 RepID=UPI0039EF8D4C